MKSTAWAWGTAIVLASLLFVACGGGSTAHPGAAPPPAPASAPGPSTTRPVEDAHITAADFRNVNTMTPVGGHFIANVNGHLAQALAVAKSPNGGVYPVGTILQLIPMEAMVKRRAGFNPATHDWEFFTLAVSAQGTKIASRGGANIVNHFSSASCASCHAGAPSKFDMVCETDHGCAPLPVGHDIFTLLQKTDPRPRQP